MLRFSPTTGDYTRETILTFTGPIPSGGQQLKCKVGDHLEAATAFRDHARCAAPPVAAPRAVAVRLTADGIRFYDAASRFTYYDADAPPTISSLAPAFGPERGGSALTVRASNLAPTGRSRCAFGTLVAAASVVEGGGLACSSPPSATGVGSVPLRVSNDGGRRWSVADDRLFTYYTTTLPLTLSMMATSFAVGLLRPCAAIADALHEEVGAPTDGVGERRSDAGSDRGANVELAPAAAAAAR